MMISNDPCFTWACWQPFSTTKSWCLPWGDGIKTVYVKFKSANGTVSQVVTDSIIVDAVCPQGSVTINHGTINDGHWFTSRNITLTFNAWDPDNRSGVSQMMISNDPCFTGATWEPYKTAKSWTLTDGYGTKSVYVKYKDNAGNEGWAYTDWCGYYPVETYHQWGWL
jgi:hypothetical protein